MNMINNTYKPSYLSPKVEVVTLNVRHSILLLSGGDYQNDQLGDAAGWNDDFWG